MSFKVLNMFQYQGVRNISSLENFAYALKWMIPFANSSMFYRAFFVVFCNFYLLNACNYTVLSTVKYIYLCTSRVNYFFKA